MEHRLRISCLFQEDVGYPGFVSLNLNSCTPVVRVFKFVQLSGVVNRLQKGRRQRLAWGARSCPFDNLSSKSNALLFVLLLSFLDDVGNLGSGKAKRVKDSNPLVAPRWESHPSGHATLALCFQLEYVKKSLSCGNLEMAIVHNTLNSMTLWPSRFLGKPGFYRCLAHVSLEYAFSKMGSQIVH
ncbi:hypothetical protein SDJN03_16341, partial [Cucurbita argyrosperma subsp. sororia]